MWVGSERIRAGQTTEPRVGANAGRVLESVNGWDCRSGALVAESLAKLLSVDSGLGATIPEQTPLPYVLDGGLRYLFARDADEHIRVYSGAKWLADSAATAVSLETDSIPVRFGQQSLFPGQGGIVAYEPGSPTTKERLFGFKGPCDYNAAAAPTITPGSSDQARLWATTIGTAWTSAYCTIAEVGEIMTVTLPDTTAGGYQIAKKSLGATGINCIAKRYLIFDIALWGNDPQDYSDQAGLFGNDAALMPSGYEIGFYSDTACTTLVRRMIIPRLDTGGTRNRVWLDLGSGSVGVVKGVALLTAQYFTAPPTGQTFRVEVYATTLTPTWAENSNRLCPPVAWTPSPWSDLLGVTITPGERTPANRIRVTAPTSPTADALQWAGILPATVPLARWRYIYAGKDLLGATDYRLMRSNPSLESADTVADPFRTYTVAMTGNASVISDYGDYATHVAVYRAIYDPETYDWTDYEPAGAAALASSVNWTDNGADFDGEVHDIALPDPLELSNDYPSSARYLAVAQKRVLGLRLDYSAGSRRWSRPTALEIGSSDRPWAFLTTPDEESLATDGTEEDGYAQSGGEGRALVARDEDTLIALDAEVFALRGTDPITGYFPQRLAGHGCASARSVGILGGVIIWSDGQRFLMLAGGALTVIGRERIDASLVDWSRAHNAFSLAADEYRLWCYYDGAWAVLHYDLVTGAWRVRPSTAYTLRGVTAHSGRAYGLTAAGLVVDLYGSSTGDYGAGDPLRSVATQYVEIAPAFAEARISQFALEAESDDPNGVEVDVTVNVAGQRARSTEFTLTVKRGITTYRVPLDLVGVAVKIEMSTTETTPPTIYGFGVTEHPLGAR